MRQQLAMGSQIYWEAYRWTAMGSSQEPGQDWTTMLDSLTPAARSFSLAPVTRGSMMVEFQRA